MTNYFAHAVYGVNLSDGDILTIREAVGEATSKLENGEGRDDWEDLSEEDKVAEALAAAQVFDPGFVDRLREKYKAGPEARVHWTGDEDNRPGRCSVGADTYVLGYGMLSVPEIEIPKAFQEQAEWLTWVEAG